MPKSLRFIFIAFIFFSSPAFLPKAFAITQADSTYQDSKSLDDYLNDDTTVVEQAASDSGDTEQTVIEESQQDYNQANFDKASGTPSQVKRELNNTQWDRMTKDPDFQYDDIKEKQPPPADYSESWWTRMFRSIFEFLGSIVGKYLVLFIVVIIVLILIARAIQLNGNILFSKKDKKIGQNDDEHSDDYIPENWDKEIADAAKAGNYRLALRHCYRYLLTTLSEKELINFQVAKTNYQYVYELSGTAYHQPFMKLTRDYEYAWYGGFEINEDFYKDYYQMIQTIHQQLKH